MRLVVCNATPSLKNGSKNLLIGPVLRGKAKQSIIPYQEENIIMELPVNDEKEPFVEEEKDFGEVTSVDPGFTSNLQIFSLKQAFIYYDRSKEIIGSADKRDYWIFAIICAGTSITQLLGQNTIHNPNKTRVDPPKKLFENLFSKNDPQYNEFESFIDIYDDCRHFGTPKYPSILSLDEKKCNQQLQYAVKLWDKIVNKYIDDDKDPNGNLNDFTTVVDLL